MNYQTFSAKLTGRNSQSRKLANNTTLLRVDRGYFQADANKTPMHRVDVTR